jgi:hypothetical protein
MDVCQNENDKAGSSSQHAGVQAHQNVKVGSLRIKRADAVDLNDAPTGGALAAWEQRPEAPGMEV